MPSASATSIERTWLPKLPLVWWFLPWMSELIAPPIVTCRVPGSTGTHRPWGSAARISVSRLTPASRSASPLSGSIEWIVARPVMSSTVPPEFCDGSP